MLIGNKADLTAERAVKKEDGVQVAKVSNWNESLKSGLKLGQWVIKITVS